MREIHGALMGLKPGFVFAAWGYFISDGQLRVRPRYWASRKGSRNALEMIGSKL